MGLIAKEAGGSFEMVAEDTYVARCYRVLDLGTHHDEKWNKDVHKIAISWELPTALMETGDYAGKPFSIHNRYTLSLSDRAILRKDLEAWRGKSFSEDELAGFDVSNLIGATCLINVVHSPDGKYANISSLMKLPSGMECPAAVNETLFLDLDNFDQDVFDKLHEKTQDFIKQSKEFEGKETGGSNKPVGDEEALICPACNADLNGEMDCPNPKCPSKNSQNERSDQPHES